MSNVPSLLLLGNFFITQASILVIGLLSLISVYYIYIGRYAEEESESSISKGNRDLILNIDIINTATIGNQSFMDLTGTKCTSLSAV